MLASRESTLAEVKDLENIISMYKEAYPDNPVFATGAKKKELKKKTPAEETKQAVQEVPQEPQVDVKQVVEDTLRTVANAVIASSISLHYNEQVGSANANVKDALHLLNKSFSNLVDAKSLNWSQAREEFVENFARLVNRSSTQVGSTSRKSYSDIEAFIRDFTASDSDLQSRQFAQ